jgi:hypothetical protein
MQDFWDEVQLLDALKASMKARRSVPPEFIQTGKNAYAWHNIDAELAQLTYDSARDAAASMRSGAASIRALTFTSTHLTIELEVADDCLNGQVIPTRPGTIEIQAHTGTVAVSLVDDLGSFRIQPIPPSPFRLSCRVADGAGVLTRWITF